MSTRESKVVGAWVSAESQFTIPMTGRQKIEFAVLVTLWLTANLLFWLWWLSPDHNIGGIRYLINTTALTWSTMMPAYYLFFLGRLRIPNPNIKAPSARRVAMVVTKTPSEPFELVQRTLEAMLDQGFPHDTWLADEHPDEATIAWCKERGVKISTRYKVAEYHRQTWPRRTGTKEGNLAYFYDHYGYGQYDIVVQMDADHVPSPGYLEAMIRPFADPRVGYVSAPSVCDSNASQSFWARGRLYAESLMHGSLQAGYFAPMCIGSHYAVRCSALREIGGLGPELAEDHSTSMLFNAGQWRGVHAIDAEAHGEGPATFRDMVVQEFQWSRSLVLILLRYSRACMKRLSAGLQMQFLFSQLWYPLFSGFMLLFYLLPIIALLTKSVWVNLIFAEYLIRASLIVLSLNLILVWVRKNGWSRPKKFKLISWEGTLFLFAKWPWVLLGVIDAVICHLRNKEPSFRVTPKGNKSDRDVPLLILLPYIILSVGAALPVLLLDNVGNATAFYIFSSLNALIYAVITAVVIYKQKAEWKRPSAASASLVEAGK